MRQPRGSLFWFLFSPRGRISRIEFWVFHLATIVMGIGGLMAIGMMAGLFERTSAFAGETVGLLFLFMTLGYLLLATVTAVAVWAKRFHDRNKSGWWSLIGLVPVLGTVWILVECGCLSGTRGSNRFGPNPLGVHIDDVGSVFD